MPPTDYLRNEHHEFMEASQQALDDKRLHTLLSRVSDNLTAKNQTAWQELDRADEVRTKAREIKDATLAELDVHLEKLEESITKRGGQVHYAADGEQACQQVLSIVQDHKATKVVKAKSMTTEEIHLNQSLEQAGIHPIETDLGEYIVQLAGHRPSHIVGPALHLSAEDITEILNTASDEPLPNDPEKLTAFARRILRQQFAEAEIGITGANFAIAETGTIVLISNEGNIRLTTSLPKVHIAIMGMEKVIPRLQDLPYFLKILPRAASGQKLSVYTSLVSGPRAEDELDGPEEFHLIVLDNGRSEILSGPLRESLFCIRCGACLNVCPIYRNVGGHAYGGVYSGPIGAVLTPLYDGLQQNEHLPQASSLCGACQAACPVKIEIPEILLKLREQLHQEPKSSNLIEKISYRMWAFILRRPRLYRLSTWIATRTIGRWKKKSGWFSRLPGELKGWTSSRDFPAPAERRFRDWWQQEDRR